MLADAMVTFNARVIPAGTTPAQPGEVPAAATLGAAGSYATEAAKLNAALPKLKAAADAYPETDAGITARYHYASSLAALGKHAEAIQAFDEVMQPRRQQQPLWPDGADGKGGYAGARRSAERRRSPRGRRWHPAPTTIFPRTPS